MTKMIFIWLTAICTLVLASIVPLGAADDAIPGAVVRTTVSDVERDYELLGATLSANGPTTELLIAARPKGRRTETETLVWASVDASGRVLSQQTLFGKLSPADAAGVNLRSPAAGSGFGFFRGRPFLLSPTAGGDIRLTGLARSNEPAAVRAVNIGARSAIIHRTVAINNEQLALIGGVGVQPAIIKVDAEGKKIAEHLLPEEGTTAINAVFEPDGGAVVVGEQGRFPNATTWVGRVGPRGEVLVETSFPGRPADIARGSDGTYLVLIERSGDDGSEILMKGLAPDLSERWTQTLMTQQRIVTSFRVAPVATGGFIIAGTKDRGLWIAHVKPDGAEAWTEAHNPLKSPELEAVSHVELVSTRDIFVVAYTAFVVVGREQREVVRTVRFRAN